MGSAACRHPGCRAAKRTRGLCSKHYDLWRARAIRTGCWEPMSRDEILRRMHDARRADIPCHDCGGQTTTHSHVTQNGDTSPWGVKRHEGRYLYIRACANGHRNWHETASSGGAWVAEVQPPTSSPEGRKWRSDTCCFEGCEYPRGLVGPWLNDPYCYGHAKHVLRYGAPRPIKRRRVSLRAAWAEFRRRRGG